MLSLLTAFFISFITIILIIRTQKLHGKITGDLDLAGPQKFHLHAVSRIGGAGIALGLYVAIAFQYLYFGKNNETFLLALCTLPVFGIGISEDLSKKLSVRIRLLFIAIGACLASILCSVNIHNLGLPGLDYLLVIPAISTLFTVFAITGLTNAYNIIDGFNGLSSMVGMITLVALGYMGIQFSDPLIIFLSFVMVGAILGFFILNYPRGLIFLGDGGAYLIGFWVAVISILIASRHPEVSPWFAATINAYPILETLFTIYRRKFHQGKSPGDPDGLHFHSLLFRRILSRSHISNDLGWYGANAKTSPYLWIMSSLAIIPAIFFWNSSIILIGFLILYIVSYIWLYKRLVTSKSPKWLNL